MKIDRAAKLDPASGIALAETPEALAVMHDPNCAAAIWQRTPMAGFQSWLDAVPAEQLPKARVILRPSDMRDALGQICDSAGMPPGAERALFIDDAAALADIFAGLMATDWIALRLEPVATNACRRFHLDALTARLICTYRGTGTQLGISKDGAQPAEPAMTVATGAPLILRGTLWDTGLGLLHRSPPIEGSGQTRLVLVLDPADDPAERP